MKFQSGIATALVATFALASPVPVDAAPIFVPRAQGAQSDIIQVRDGWYRGYRGSRHYRRGYHRHNDFWFPAGAFVAGALLGGAIANNNGYYGGYYRSGVYGGDPYYGGSYYGDPYYRAPYYADSYYADPYYRAPYYGNRYYGNRHYGYHSNRSYRPCSPREADSGNCY
ncbi:BA14K family protein [Mesorhizobium amorphae]|uniref:BA14K family protein n=1 Tax=Mesorhizobium amorphae TaxID=71433 RepID=UPI001780E7FD|nr:BA14K family protein [Mesorhizobium amorphae]